MKTLFTLLLFLVTIPLFSQWEQTNGPVDNILISDIISKDSILIASAPCGIYLTSNEGISWRPVDFNAFTTSEIFNDTIYLGGSQGIKKFFISYGRWQVTSVLVIGGLNELYADNVTIYSAYTYHGFQYSSDGKKWQSYNEGLPKITHTIPRSTEVYYSYNAFTVNGNDNYLFVGASNGLYRSSKTSLKWINVSADMITGLVNAIYCQGPMVMVASENKVYKSENNGDTWQLIHTFSANTTINKIEGIDGTVYVLTNQEGLYLSNDMGMTWMAHNNGLMSQSVNCITKHKDHLYAGNIDGVYSDLSQWTRVDKNFICSTIYDLEKTNSSIAAVDSKNIHISSDQGITWRNSTSSIEMKVLYSVVNVNNALIFSALPRGYTANCTNYISRDNGVSWIEHGVLTNYGDPYSLISNGSKVLAVTDAIVFMSDDLKESWSEISPPGGMICNNFISVLFTGDDIYVTGCSEGQLIKSSDYGLNWAHSNQGLPRYDIIYGLAECQGILFACSASGLFKSVDKGNSWQKCGNGIPTSTSTVYDMVSDEQFIYLCTKRNVYASSDKGENFYDISSGLPALPDKSGGALLVKDNYLFYGTNNFGVWKRPVSNIVLTTQGVLQNKALQVYPNPAKTRVHFTLPDHQLIEKAELFDLSGRRVYVSYNTSENSIDIQSLLKGIYLLKITAVSNEMFHSKVIKTD